MSKLMRTNETEKQSAYIKSLTEQIVKDTRPSPVTPSRDRAMKLTVAVLATSLPSATTSAEASEQIDALKDGTTGMQRYAAAHREWATPILKTLQTRYGGGDSIPRVGTEGIYQGAEMPVSEWAAFVKQAV